MSAEVSMNSELCPVPRPGLDYRIRENSVREVQRALNAGASGVQAPKVDTKTDAERAANAARFHPLGNREVAPYGPPAVTMEDLISNPNRRRNRC